MRTIFFKEEGSRYFAATIAFSGIGDRWTMTAGLRQRGPGPISFYPRAPYCLYMMVLAGTDSSFPQKARYAQSRGKRPFGRSLPNR